MICKFWREYDDDKGLFEYCKLVNKTCYCCGTLKQCNYKYQRMPIRMWFKNLIRRIT